MKCPIPSCCFETRSSKIDDKTTALDRLYGHLHTSHRKPEIIKAILILAGLKEDLEEAS